MARWCTRDGSSWTAAPSSRGSPLRGSRARGFIAGIKEKVAGLKRLGEAADRLDLGELAEQGLGLLLDDVLGPATSERGGNAGASASTSAAHSARVCIALDHEHMPAHRARYVVEGPA